MSVTQRYVVNGGVSALSFIETAESPIAGGDSLQDLVTGERLAVPVLARARRFQSWMRSDMCTMRRVWCL